MPVRLLGGRTHVPLLNEVVAEGFVWIAGQASSDPPALMIKMLTKTHGDQELVNEMALIPKLIPLYKDCKLTETSSAEH